MVESESTYGMSDLVLSGFLQEPKPSRYRVSNEPTCTIAGP